MSELCEQLLKNTFKELLLGSVHKEAFKYYTRECSSIVQGSIRIQAIYKGVFKYQISNIIEGNIQVSNMRGLNRWKHSSITYDSIQVLHNKEIINNEELNIRSLDLNPI